MHHVPSRASSHNNPIKRIDMKIIITPTLLVVADYDGDELVVPLYPHEHRKLVEMAYPHICTETFDDGTDVWKVGPPVLFTERELYKEINTVIRNAYKDVRRKLPR
jgi:hypothetical protein